MRGKPMQTADKVDEHRIIPAHAGQTARPCTSSADLTDHPRACGANSVIAIDAMVVPGSSPRMRGKLKHLGDLIDHRWIIPAHAGQTRCERCRRYGRADHPRACGANRRCAMVRQLAYGSSPRMRGKLSPTTSRYNFPRIIPAHAGQTAPYVHRTFCRADHPRACGANGGANCRRWHAIGSSPRMRGKHAVAGAARRVVRIIPAHAGQTSGLTYPMPSVADHPRACGANFRVREVVDAYAGSSPRMRGKRLHKRHRGKPVRIIPAHAGQT